MTIGTKDEQQAYQKLASAHTPPRTSVRNTLRAFVVGGLICAIGQAVQLFFIRVAHFSPTDAGNPTVAVMIFLSVVLTACGVYDKFGQWAGAGSAVPVTGFANTMASAAMEHRSEGWVTGIGGNMFKLAGPVIVYGVVSAFFVGLIRYLFFHL
ncbi:stage V sporulation protein AC [Alicyclobacillus cycloheptanicus]|jgi:stage V sporulation protein AC|uniref:Stage V sporulation protein AC n=1 Tax=Alicyclobacillus cycloheptanicus TaxID=1457 RepID=A0ABT9XDR5_9BACL|nr:stage V sporulation protein AC [Alicyclobacillus cycloheptanicus]MDQ0188437.1 stage V sporulation protein AC [Alicyclobacillus cycloheptanicus]WDM01137.1 stage V sporulation protein AC [Alicyclobacillus cycloheptanicus]